jgi:cytochrome bd ubiquinol oxidase subunit I
MDSLLAARAQMEVSLAFHMIFAALGIGMPLLMVFAEGLWLRTGREHYRALAKKWAKATALTFAVGAVSGTALSFELGLLWPRFMAFAGAIIGPAFALEGYAFFVEAIFLGLYLYGWDRLSPRAHWLTGIPVALSGLASGILVVAANAWMQTPSGFRLEGGELTDVDPFAVFTTPAWFQMALHSSLSCYIATGFAVAGVYAGGMLRGRRDAYHRSALRLSLALAAVTALLQPLSGDVSARNVAEYQPAKLAAMEAHFETRARAPLLIGGWPDMERGDVNYAIRIPGGLSFLAFGDPDAEVKGLEEFPRDQWPHVPIVHTAFQIMVALGTYLALLSLWVLLAAWRRHDIGSDGRMLAAIALAAPMGFIAIEAGWTVTEVGRQPWIIYGVMRTADAVTPMPGLVYPFLVFTVLYCFLGVIVAWLLYRQILRSPRGSEWSRIYAPHRRADA